VSSLSIIAVVYRGDALSIVVAVQMYCKEDEGTKDEPSTSKILH
jgi:hypothetical protein